MKHFPRFAQVVFMAAMAVTMLSCRKDETDTPGEARVFSATGDITGKVNEFRAVLGDSLNNSTGKVSGRREINWDGVPDEFMETSLPLDFFNATGVNDAQARKRGFAYASNGNFRISNANFSNIDPSNGTQFSAFSGSKIFANTSAVVWDARFKVAGENRDASISAFGAVFTDADLANTSFLEFFSGDKSLGKFFVPPHDGTSSLSFLGVYFEKATITRVRIGHGNGDLEAGAKDVSLGGAADLVALDDFLYSEPLASD